MPAPVGLAPAFSFKKATMRRETARSYRRMVLKRAALAAEPAERLQLLVNASGRFGAGRILFRCRMSGKVWRKERRAIACLDTRARILA
jgi:hypothetical protein